MGNLLERVEKYIIAKIRNMSWVHIDEAVFKCGYGHKDMSSWCTVGE